MPEVPIRPAATVMLLRDGAAGPEVYLLRRVAQMAFAGGMTAFPGGGVDARDAAPIGWRGPGPEWWAAQFGADAELAGSVVVAAVRELFEEIGVLLIDLPTPAPDAAALAELRHRIVDHQIGLDTVVGEGSIRADRLRPWARWVTPAGQSRRYDTFFLLALLPDGAEARMLTTEAEAGQWMRPDEALSAAALGEIALMPPTVAMLTELAVFSSTTHLLAAERMIETVAPQPISGLGEPLRVLVAGTEFGALGMPPSSP
ncbi:MAG: NUDIX domain-containing protein [Actinomycetota bacterium]|nr:NUDIX domain-containing protein [Actinomycetota bacterium]